MSNIPNDGMVTAARRALDWHKEGRRGGTRVGLTRANQIVARENLSDDTVKRMYSFFSRHEVDKKATGFRSGEEGYPSPGRVAWDLWGGDAGYSWSRKRANAMKSSIATPKNFTIMTQVPIKPFSNVVEHAGTGLKMPETIARKIEALSSGLPKDFGYRRLAKGAANLQCDAGERTDISTITTNEVDRDGDVVIPSGGDWSQYNRVVCFAHDYSQLPVGSNWWIKSRGNGLIAKTHYPTKPADWGDGPWLPSAILHLMQQPVPTCTGKSIGFLPLNIRSATPQEISINPEWANSPIIDKWMGLEYSCCPIGSNPGALTEAVSKGFFDQRTADVIDRASKIIFPMNGAIMPKAMSESANQSGGDVVDDTADDDNSDNDRLPDCPTCKSPDMVKLLPPPPGSTSPCADYNCMKCGTNFTVKDDDMGGEEMASVSSATKAIDLQTTLGDNKPTVQVDDPDKDGDIDAVVTCPYCRKEAKQIGNVEIPGIGQFDRYECGTCNASFFAEESQVPNPNTNGNNNGTGTQTFANLPTPKSATEGTKKLNASCESRAMEAAKSGKVNNGAWEAPNGGDRKQEDCLGIREGENVEPSKKFTDPIFMGGELYRRAVANVESRESGNEIGEAAKRIMAAIQDHTDKSVEPWYDPADVAAYKSAKKKQIESAYLDALIPVVADMIETRLGRP
jgi:transposase-like protein